MNKAIGVIDSGVGGLTIAKEIMRQLPKETIIYLGDNARCPYGPRTRDEVLSFTAEMVDFLIDHNIKALVIACNTATAFTLDYLKERLHIPVIGVIEAGARAAISSTKTDYIGVIGTKGTIDSGAYSNALKMINPDIKVHSLACPLFVPLVESGNVKGKEAFSVVENSLRSLCEFKEIDTLILGCTHYPLLKETIQEVVINSVKLISSSMETAKELNKVLEEKNLKTNSNKNPDHQIYTTGDIESFRTLLIKIFPDEPLFKRTLIKKAFLQKIK